MTRRHPAIAFLLLAASAGALAAQQLDSAFWAGIPSERLLRVEVGGTMLETRRHQADAAGVRLRAVLRPTFDRSVFADTTIANELVSRVWVQDQTHWRRGALIGAAVAAVVSGAMMVTFWGDNDVPFDESLAPVSFAVTVAAGGLVGAGGGLFFIRWRRVWPP